MPDKTENLTKPAPALLAEAARTLSQVDFLQDFDTDGRTPDGSLPVLRVTDREGVSHRFAALMIENGPSGRDLAAQVAEVERFRGRSPGEQTDALAYSSPGIVETGRQLRELARNHGAEHDAIVIGRFVGPLLREMLRGWGLNYLDLAGNLYLALGDGRFVAQIEGRKPLRRPRLRVTGLRAAGYRVLYAILARAELLQTTVREIERHSGASRQAASELLARLRDEGALVRAGRSAHHVIPGRRDELIARFVTGWVDALRPGLLIGSFRRREPATVDADAAIERVLAQHELAWGFGGSAAAMRLSPHYRGADTVLHVAVWNDDLSRALGLVPERGGTFRIYRTMGGLDLSGTPAHCAHPLLAYAELVTSNDERARESARLLHDALLRESSR